MAKKQKRNRRLTEELLETAQDMRARDLIGEVVLEKIGMRLREQYPVNGASPS
jgi:hypothetical protein